MAINLFAAALSWLVFIVGLLLYLFAPIVTSVVSFDSIFNEPRGILHPESLIWLEMDSANQV